jgi:hypothetical protein
VDTKTKTPELRIVGKTDTAGYAKFYLSFPFFRARPDVSCEKWFAAPKETGRDLLGPAYGRWGCC